MGSFIECRILKNTPIPSKAKIIIPIDSGIPPRSKMFTILFPLSDILTTLWQIHKARTNNEINIPIKLGLYNYVIFLIKTRGHIKANVSNIAGQLFKHT